MCRYFDVVWYSFNILGTEVGNTENKGTITFIKKKRRRKYVVDRELSASEKKIANTNRANEINATDKSKRKNRIKARALREKNKKEIIQLKSDSSELKQEF